MIALRLVDPCPWPTGYSSHVVQGWLPGEVREVDDAEAARLVETYPGLFLPELPADPTPDPAPEAEPKRARARKGA